MELTGSLNEMGINVKTIGLSITRLITSTITCAALTLLISTAASAAPVKISYQSAGTSTALNIKGKKTLNAGLREITIDGNSSLAVSTSSSSMTGTWMATENSYADIQAGAGKYNNGGGKGLEKYAKAGYLFSLLDVSTSLSSTAAKYNALVNYVIWEIMGTVSKKKQGLSNKREKALAKDLKRKADQNKKFDWSSTMKVYTANDRKATSEYFAVLPPIATPIPGTLFLFGSMALGLFGIVTRKKQTMG
jgi:hypothetical protein